MSIEFVIERHTGGIDRLEREELIEQMTDDHRNDLHDDVEDQVSEFQDQLSDMSDEELARAYADRTGEPVRIEESEDE